MTDQQTFKVSVKTGTTEDGKIEQIVHVGSERLAHEIFNTKEKQFREAMIKLGWLPPDEAARLRYHLEAMHTSQHTSLKDSHG